MQNKYQNNNFISKIQNWQAAFADKYAPSCTVNADAPDLIDNEYKIFSDVPVSFDAARVECQKFGENWDLVIFNFEREYQRITDIISQNCLDDFAFWIGYTDYNLEQKTIFGQGMTQNLKI